MRYSIEDIEPIARDCDWTFVVLQTNIGMISYRKEDEENGKMRINIYMTKGTVSTAIKHPKHGKTQLFRKNVTLDQLTQIFINPRQHTGKGYYRK